MNNTKLWTTYGNVALKSIWYDQVMEELIPLYDNCNMDVSGLDILTNRNIDIQ